MTKFTKFFAAVMLVVNVICSAPGHAEPRCDYYRGCGQWGGWGWGPWGPGVGWGQGNPYFYGPRCGWVRVRAWYSGQRVVRRVWRCW